jgi:hypothetical protein
MIVLATQYETDQITENRMGWMYGWHEGEGTCI